MAKQSEWSVMCDQDKSLTVPLCGRICVYSVDARRILWIGVTGRCSLFWLSSIIIEDYKFIWKF